MSTLREEVARLAPQDEFAVLAAEVARLHSAGHDFQVQDGRLLIGANRVVRETAIDIGRDHIRLGLVSDTHAGSHAEQLTALRHFYRYADDQEVDAFIHAGDWVQGSDRMHPDQPYQVHVHGADQQVAYAVATYPRSQRPGVVTYGISGNHDDSFLKDGGMNVLRQITERRDDIRYLGIDAAYLTLGSLKSYVIHPRGGMPYSKSYRLQKIAESQPISRQLNLLLMGHLHSFAMVQEHGMTAILLPCFQGQYGWLATGGLHPDIGGIILDVWMTDDGAVGRMRSEFVRYQSLHDDWDHDVSREVAHGWTPEGLVVP